MKKSDLQSKGLQSLKEAFYLILKAPTSLYWESCAEIEAEIVTQIKPDSHGKDLKPKDIESAFVQLSKIKSIFESHIPSPDAHELIAKAREAFKQKDYRMSHGYFSELLKTGYRPDVTLLLHAATTAYYAKDFEAAQRLVEEVLEKNALENSALILKGLLLMESQKWKEAIRFFNQAHEGNPHSKIIQQSLQICRERVTSTSAPSVIHVKRQWKRIPLKRKIQINDFGSYMVMPYEITSLSAGGCLIATTGIPREFQFRIDVTPKSQIFGLGRVVYETPNRESGIKFESLSKSEQLMLDETIKSLASSRR